MRRALRSKTFTRFSSTQTAAADFGMRSARQELGVSLSSHCRVRYGRRSSKRRVRPPSSSDRVAAHEKPSASDFRCRGTALVSSPSGRAHASCNSWHRAAIGFVQDDRRGASRRVSIIAAASTARYGWKVDPCAMRADLEASSSFAALNDPLSARNSARADQAGRSMQQRVYFFTKPHGKIVRPRAERPSELLVVEGSPGWVGRRS